MLEEGREEDFDSFFFFLFFLSPLRRGGAVGIEPVLAVERLDDGVGLLLRLLLPLLFFLFPQSKLQEVREHKPSTRINDTSEGEGPEERRTVRSLRCGTATSDRSAGRVARGRGVRAGRP